MSRQIHDLFREASLALDSGHIVSAAATLESLGSHSLTAAQCASRDSLHSDALLTAGHSEHAFRLASRISEHKQVPYDVLARALVVLAVIAGDSGHLNQALDLAARARHCASLSSDHVLRARLETRLLSALVDSMPPAEAMAHLSNAYALVHISADTGLLAHLHIVHAMLEGRRGLVDRAWRHIGIANDVLTHASNPLVHSLISLTSMIVASLEDDHGATVQFGRNALEASIKNGYLRLVPRIQSNLGLALLRTGKLDQAVVYFDAATSHRLSTTSFIGACDSRAQLFLLRDNYDECNRLLVDAFNAVGDAQDRYHWYRLGLLDTLLHLKLDRGDDDAAAQARSARSFAEAQGHKNFASMFALLEARAHCAQGETDAALAAASNIDTSIGEVALTTIGQREAILALIHSLASRWPLATLHFGRAKRIMGTLGTTVHRRDLKRVEDAIAAHRPAPEHSTEQPADSIDNAGFLVECSMHPDILAREALSQLLDSQAIVSALVVREARSDESPALRLLADADPDRPADIEVPLGTLRGSRCVLKVWTRDATLTHRSRVVARVTAAAAAQREAHRTALERSAVWPESVRPLQVDGVFDAPAMRKALSVIERVAPTPISVLFLGETGTGKEVLARALHERSPRARGPFVPFNCATVPHDLLDAQLFGHVRGAFTGAVGDSIGVIRAADGGTLFLDEIGDMPLMAQPKLLRFLERGEVHPVGAVRPVAVDVRIAAATNLKLLQMVRDGRFREDLYFRLNGLTVAIPPLRARQDDIPTLARLFLGRFSASMGRPTPVLSPGAMELLLIHPWPGNVRQLSNQMRRLAALSPPGEPITADQLEMGMDVDDDAGRSLDEAALLPAQTAHHDASNLTLEDAVRRLEREMISAALRDAKGQVTEAAARLGISRKGLFLKRRRLGLE